MSTIDPDDWIAADPDPGTRAELSRLGPDALAERFADTLHFGTAGLRGPVRAGPNGMNVAVVTRTTWALGRFLLGHGHEGATVVVGRDARHGSAAFATAAAQVLTAQGFDVVTLAGPGPTPLVAFACRDLGAAGAITVTASHNPPDDNGYKVYLAGGAQLIPPADQEIEDLIATAPAANTIARQHVSTDSRAQMNTARYLDRLSARFGTVHRSPVRIALTAMHGVGGTLALRALRRAGFADIHVVAEQFAPDPDFPTVRFPNPEEPGAADRVLALARRIDADLAIALDPDADRCAIGARVHGGWRMLTGDETGALLGSHLLSTTELAAPIVANTIVSGSLLPAVARAAGVRHVRTLTGFKWLVRAGEPLLYAYEEAIGHCVDPVGVRDKDGIGAAVVAAKLTHELIGTRSDLSGALDDLARRHGVHVTTQRSIRLTDPAEITELMTRLRTAPPRSLAGVPVRSEDFAARTDALRTDAVELTGTATDGTSLRVMARPSGTEPKLKYYLEVVAAPHRDHRGDDLAGVGAELHDLAARIAAELPPGA